MEESNYLRQLEYAFNLTGTSTSFGGMVNRYMEIENEDQILLWSNEYGSIDVVGEFPMTFFFWVDPWITLSGMYQYRVYLWNDGECQFC